MVNYGWWGIDLDVRNSGNMATYSNFKFEQLPQVNIPDEFKNITTVELLKKKLPDLRKNISLKILFKSPTDCYFDFNLKNNAFYRDQQDCIVWYVDEKSGYVYAGKTIVSKSLPEFLTRIRIENAIWFMECYNIPINDKNLHEEVGKYLKHYEQLANKLSAV